MFSFAACNNNATEEPVDTTATVEEMVEEVAPVVDSAAQVVEEVAAEVAE